MESALCPSCRRHTVQTACNANGSEESVCASCGWVGPLCFGVKHDPNNVKCAGGNDPSYWSGATHQREACSFYGRCQEAMSMNVPVRQQIEPNTSPTILGMIPSRPVAPTPTPHPVMPPAMTPGTSQTYPTPIQQMSSLQQALANQTRLPAPLPQVQQTYQAQPQYPVQSMYQRPVQQGTQTQAYPVQQQQAYAVHGSYFASQPQHMPVQLVAPENASVPAYAPQNHILPGVQSGSFLTVPEPPPVKPQDIWRMAAAALGRGAIKGGLMTALNIVDYYPWTAYFHRP